MECIPVSIFKWQRKGEYKTEALVAEIMDATKMWSSRRGDNHVFSAEDKDVAAWLLISTASDLDHDSYQSSEQEEANAEGCWRLALLVNNMVITGSIVDEGYEKQSHLFLPNMLWEVPSIKKFSLLSSDSTTCSSPGCLAGLLQLLPHLLVMELSGDAMDKFTCWNYPQGRS